MIVSVCLCNQLCTLETTRGLCIIEFPNCAKGMEIKNRKIVAAKYSIAIYLVFYSRQPLEDCAFVHGRYRYDVGC